MAQRRADLDTELEYEDEAFFGGLAKIAGSLLGEEELEDEFEAEDELEGEYEDEFEMELEDEFESEWEDEDEDEAFFGGLAKIAGSLLGEGEDEYEDELEMEYEDEAEEFFKNIGRAFRKAAPFLKVLAKTAGPLVATAVGGPAAGMLARAVTSQLEGEFEDELEAELEDMATAPMTPHQAMAEYLAGRAAAAESEAEAEAFAGAAVYVTLSGQDRRDLENLLPQLVRGAAVITRLLHQSRSTRQAVRLVPGIVDGAARTLQRTSGGGYVEPAQVGRALGTTTGRVLSGGPALTALTRRHARGLAVSHRRRHGHHGHQGGSYDQRWYPGRGGSAHPQRRGHTGRPGQAGRPRHAGRSGQPGQAGTRVVRRTPSSTRVVSRTGRVAPPKPGFVRVVTPVRIPPKGGRPAQTVRVVSDVKVPRGATPAGRPASVPARRKTR
jgi:hypothetical protein